MHKPCEYMAHDSRTIHMIHVGRPFYVNQVHDDLDDEDVGDDDADDNDGDGSGNDG